MIYGWVKMYMYVNQFLGMNIINPSYSIWNLNKTRAPQLSKKVDITSRFGSIQSARVDRIMMTWWLLWKRIITLVVAQGYLGKNSLRGHFKRTINTWTRSPPVMFLGLYTHENLIVKPVVNQAQATAKWKNDQLGRKSDEHRWDDHAYFRTKRARFLGANGT